MYVQTRVSCSPCHIATIFDILIWRNIPARQLCRMLLFAKRAGWSLLWLLRASVSMQFMSAVSACAHNSHVFVCVYVWLMRKSARKNSLLFASCALASRARTRMTHPPPQNRPPAPNSLHPIMM